ncbi:helix-turn-helix transcriptional regulator [Actinoplanes sp. NBRC 101535]|uniref:helix-turn-helix domain-containing protein n=1 Tax=Actinoplanes sp. NBRC 101535 TaxID=3032196 RepID=UPI002557C417|nr:helix-turn-helix transcriptional regulator [Actinoplanes sp. NBRC 101535]
MGSPAREIFAERLRTVRERSGRTLRELQAATFVSDSSLSRYLSGQSVPPWTVVVAICELGQVDPDQLRPAWLAARGRRETQAAAAASEGRLGSALRLDIATVAKAVTVAIQSVRNGEGPVLEPLLAAERAATAAARRLADQSVSRPFKALGDGGTKK